MVEQPKHKILYLNGKLPPRSELLPEQCRCIDMWRKDVKAAKKVIAEYEAMKNGNKSLV